MSKIITGRRAKIMANGKEVAFYNGIITVGDKHTNEIIDRLRVEFGKAIEGATIFRTPIIVEPITITVNLTTFEDKGIVNWKELVNHEDTSSDAMVEWMDMQANMSDEERAMQEFWDQVSE